MKKIIAVLNCVYLLSCTTPKPESESTTAAASTDSADSGKVDPKASESDQGTTAKPDAMVGEAGECPPKEPACAEIFSPSYCVGKAYKGEVLSEDEKIRGWGENSCSAKVALAMEACRLGKIPSAVKNIECVPDVSRGKCPTQRTICTMDVSPSECSAGQYAGQKLTDNQGMTSTGSNECDARNNLLQLACVKNLDPENLGEIKCKSAK